MWCNVGAFLIFACLFAFELKGKKLHLSRSSTGALTGDTASWLTIKTNQVKFRFLRRGETGAPGENLSVQSKEPTNSTYTWCRIWDSNPGHIDGRRVLSLQPWLLISSSLADFGSYLPTIGRVDSLSEWAHCKYVLSLK